MMVDVSMVEARSSRPLAFMFCVWGEVFTRRFLNFCIPSFLAPNNLPVLGPGGHKFLIACPTEDFETIRRAPVAAKLSEFVELVHLKIDLPGEGVLPTSHMGIGHKLATEYALREAAYGCVLPPDCMISDGTIAYLMRMADEGADVVLVPALRFEEEAWFAALEADGIVDPAVPHSQSGGALALSGRDMVRLGVPAFHSHTRSYFFDSPWFYYDVSAAIWRMPTDGGVLIHALSWAPLLMNYARVRSHDTTCLEQWTMDGDYVFANFGLDADIRICDDSDDAIYVSWGAKNERPLDLTPDPLRAWFPLWRRWINSASLRGRREEAIFDPLKQRIFHLPLRWHVEDLGPEWRSMEKQAKVDIALAGPRAVHIFRATEYVAFRMRWNKERIQLLCRAIIGDPKARDYLRKRVREILGFRPA